MNLTDAERDALWEMIQAYAVARDHAHDVWIHPEIRPAATRVYEDARAELRAALGFEDER